MITTIISIVLAFYWLLLETDYLRVRLLVGCGECPLAVDYDKNYDGSSSLFEEDYQYQLDKAVKEHEDGISTLARQAV